MPALPALVTLPRAWSTRLAAAPGRQAGTRWDARSYASRFRKAKAPAAIAITA